LLGITDVINPNHIRENEKKCVLLSHNIGVRNYISVIISIVSLQETPEIEICPHHIKARNKKLSHYFPLCKYKGYQKCQYYTSYQFIGASKIAFIANNIIAKNQICHYPPPYQCNENKICHEAEYIFENNKQSVISHHHIRGR